MITDSLEISFRRLCHIRLYRFAVVVEHDGRWNPATPPRRTIFNPSVFKNKNEVNGIPLESSLAASLCKPRDTVCAQTNRTSPFPISFLVPSDSLYGTNSPHRYPLLPLYKILMMYRPLSYIIVSMNPQRLHLPSPTPQVSVFASHKLQIYRKPPDARRYADNYSLSLPPQCSPRPQAHRSHPDLV